MHLRSCADLKEPGWPSESLGVRCGKYFLPSSCIATFSLRNQPCVQQMVNHREYPNLASNRCQASAFKHRPCHQTNFLRLQNFAKYVYKTCPLCFLEYARTPARRQDASVTPTQGQKSVKSGKIHVWGNKTSDLVRWMDLWERKAQWRKDGVNSTSYRRMDTILITRKKERQRNKNPHEMKKIQTKRSYTIWRLHL